MSEVGNGKPKLMVVDDEQDNLMLLFRTFRREFEVFKAESGTEALQVLAQEGEMAVIISDQRMPRMSGIEFLSQTVEPYPDTIRIILTGYTDVQDLVEAINNGKVFKYITKPWDADELRAVVYQAAETYRVLKQRTNQLNRALRRESLFNAVMAAIRESLDYGSMLQTIVETLGTTFEADACVLRPVRVADGAIALSSRSPSTSEEFPDDLPLLLDPVTYLAESLPPPAKGKSMVLGTDLDTLIQVIRDRQVHQSQLVLEQTPVHQLVIPLIYQQEVLAVLTLYQKSTTSPWSVEEIRLLESVAEQAALAISQAKLYQRIQEQTEQMRAELAVARQIQTNLLRQQLPELDNLRIQACCFPAREVGGDFFEVFLHPQGDIWLAVGDVSGKGVPAALFMASAISVLRRELSQELPPDPHVVMQNLNSGLSDDLVSSNCFITMVLARYTPSTQQLVYANAGHIYPLVWSHQQVTEQFAQTHGSITVQPTYLKTRGVPLGILPVWNADAGRLSLRTGEVLLLASDGITEATILHQPGMPLTPDGQSNGTMLRQSGLWQLITQQKGDLSLTQVLARIQAHTQVQEDDQTILSLEVL